MTVSFAVLSEWRHRPPVHSLLHVYRSPPQSRSIEVGGIGSAIALTWGVEGDFNHGHTNMGDKLGRLV